MSLHIKNLNKSFGDKVIFSDFSYDFFDKGIYIIKGDSGIGKTTLLRMIAGLDRSFDGTIEGGGIKNVSFMFQEYRLFPTVNAIQNILIGLEETDETKKAAESLLLRLGFSKNDCLKKPSELSGGMKQRVAFARAVTRAAPILILDEPTKELDENSVQAMINIISKEAERRLVLIVTHDDLSCIANTAEIISL